jgi:hypothetical protein
VPVNGYMPMLFGFGFWPFLIWIRRPATLIWTLGFKFWKNNSRTAAGLRTETRIEISLETQFTILHFLKIFFLDWW